MKRRAKEDHGLRLILIAAGVLLLSMLDVVEGSRSGRWQVGIVRRAQWQLSHHLSTDDASAQALSGTHVVVISAPGFILGVHGGSMHQFYSGVTPASFHHLTFGQRALLLRRTSMNGFELAAAGVPIFSTRDERSFRGLFDAFKVGDSVDAGVFHATVKRVRELGAVEAIDFDFGRPLEDPALVFMTSTSTGLQRLKPPPVGKTVVIPLPQTLTELEP